ncbi:MAG: hypothetical protein U0736_11400 [Gemmataceae bacterium]
MRQLLRRLWCEERASASPEWALIATILVLGAITGAVLSRHASPAEPDDVRVVRSAR